MPDFSCSANMLCSVMNDGVSSRRAVLSRAVYWQVTPHMIHIMVDSWYIMVFRSLSHLDSGSGAVVKTNADTLNCPEL